MVKIRMHVAPEVLKRWRATVAAYRLAAGQELEEWEVFALVLRRFRRATSNSRQRPRAREPPASG
jgi:hypothetical protein